MWGTHYGKSPQHTAVHRSTLQDVAATHFLASLTNYMEECENHGLDWTVLLPGLSQGLVHKAPSLSASGLFQVENIDTLNTGLLVIVGEQRCSTIARRSEWSHN